MRPQNAPPSSAACPPDLTLREYWARLQHAKEVGAPMPGESANAAPAAHWREASSEYSSSRSSGGSFRRSSGSSGSSGGSGGLGYGLGLILPDAKARRQVKDVMDILRELCEKDAARAQTVKKSKK